MLPESPNLPANPTYADLSVKTSTYTRIVPPVTELLSFCEVPIVWSVLRPALPPIYEKNEGNAEQQDPSTAMTVPGICWLSVCMCLSFLSLSVLPGSPITDSMLREITKTLLPSCSYPAMQDFYMLFWRLDLHDVWIPESTYMTQIKLIAKDIETV